MFFPPIEEVVAAETVEVEFAANMVWFETIVVEFWTIKVELEGKAVDVSVELLTAFSVTREGIMTYTVIEYLELIPFVSNKLMLI